MCEASTRTSRAGPSTVRVWISRRDVSEGRAQFLRGPLLVRAGGHVGGFGRRAPPGPYDLQGHPAPAGLGGGEAYGRRVFADAHDDPAAHRRHRLVVVAAAQHDHRAGGLPGGRAAR